MFTFRFPSRRANVGYTAVKLTIGTTHEPRLSTEQFCVIVESSERPPTRMAWKVLEPNPAAFRARTLIESGNRVGYWAHRERFGLRGGGYPRARRRTPLYGLSSRHARWPFLRPTLEQTHPIQLPHDGSPGPAHLLTDTRHAQLPLSPQLPQYRQVVFCPGLRLRRCV